MLDGNSNYRAINLVKRSRCDVLRKPFQFAFSASPPHLAESSQLFLRVDNASWYDEIQSYSFLDQNSTDSRLLREYNRYRQMNDSDRITELKHMTVELSKTLSKSLRQQS